MKLHLEKAQHNEKFLAYLENNVPKDFNDWKITVIFYTCLHYLKAYLKKHKITPGNSHSDLDKQINPDNSKLLPSEIYDSYSFLYTTSRTARYTVLYKNENMRDALMQYQYNQSKLNYQTFVNFIKKSKFED